MTQTILPFKIEKTEELITPNSGVSLYLELYRSAKVDRSVRELFPKPGSAKGFKANAYIVSILILFLSGGKYIEDIRKIRLDKALRKIGRLSCIPSADAIGDWMRTHSDEKIEALEKVHRRLSKRFLKQINRRSHTLDIDAFSIESGKDTAKKTYKGFDGYMPIVGHLAELDWLIGYEFREGNTAPNTRNLEFLKTCFANMPKGHAISDVRIDGAGYQADIFNWLDQKRVKFTITGAKKGQVIDEISIIPESDWVPFFNKHGYVTDRMVSETYTKMENTDYFRVIIQRWKNPHPDLFGNASHYCYHIICTNYSTEEKSAQDVIFWHNQRANSEKYYSQAKSGFNLSYMPCDHLRANAIWFSLGLLAYNFHIFAKEHLFPQSWRQKTIQTIRWEFIHIAGKVTTHARNTTLKLAGVTSELINIFKQARLNCAAYAGP